METIDRIGISGSDALLVIDVQNDFMPGGALAVPHGDEVVPLVNELAKRFANVILTQDWHPARHISFASSHHGKGEYEDIILPYGPQKLWPDHCIQGTHGAELHAGLSIPHAQLLVRKGYRSGVDSYSAFMEADGKPTGLTGYFRERSIRRVFMCGLATDYCVAWSATSARKAGFGVVVVSDACRAINVNSSLAMAWQDMDKAGVGEIHSSIVLASR